VAVVVSQALADKRRADKEVAVVVCLRRWLTRRADKEVACGCGVS
jgi:hypothetical protein